MSDEKPKRRRKAQGERWLKTKILQHVAACPECLAQVGQHFFEACSESLKNGSELQLGSIRVRRGEATGPDARRDAVTAPAEL